MLNDELARENIVGTPDMEKVANEKIDTGQEARDFAAPPAFFSHAPGANWPRCDPVRLDDNGAVVGYPHGRKPSGKLTYTRDGQMWAFTGQDAPAQAPRAGNLYTGTFRIDVDKRTVIHRVHYSSIAAWESTLLLRRYEFSGRRRLTLRAPFGEQTGVLRWRKSRAHADGYMTKGRRRSRGAARVGDVAAARGDGRSA